MKGLLIGLGSGLAMAGVACCVADRFYFKRKYTVAPNVTVAFDWSNPNSTSVMYDDDVMYWVGSN